MTFDCYIVYERIKSIHGWVPCYVCGGKVESRHASLEHIIPRSKGGGDVPSNYSVSHRECNWKKGDQIMRSASALSEIWPNP